MTSCGDRSGRLAGLALAVLVAACQPLPHPFADDRPPAALLKVRGVAGVAIAPIEGEPAVVAATLGAAVADALLKRDIPASDKTTSLGSYQLYGRLEGEPREWELGDAPAIERLAKLSAAGLAPLLEEEAPVESAAGGRTRIAIGAISGAPGDGANSLAAAVATVLRKQDRAIVENG